jgi:serine protease Do/serine protease DegQ
LSFNGKPVRGVRELQLLVASSPIGEEVPVEILRDGTNLTLGVTIVARDDSSAATLGKQAPVELEPWLGISFEETSEGLRIADLADGSVAAVGGLQQGDLLLAVNRQPVGSLAELKRLQKKLPSRGNVLLLIQRGNAHLYVALPLDE